MGWQSLKGRSSLVVDASCSDQVDKSSGKHVYTPDTLTNHIVPIPSITSALRYSCILASFY